MIYESKTPMYRCNDFTLREYQYLEVIREIDPCLFQEMSVDLSKDSLLNGDPFHKIEPV